MKLHHALKISPLYFYFMLLFCVHFLYASSCQSIQFQLSGIQGQALTNAWARLSVIQHSMQKPLQSALMPYFLTSTAHAILGAIKPYGYFEATIAHQYSIQDGHCTIHYQITPGTRVRVRQIKVMILGDGKTDPHFKALTRHLPLHSNQPLNTIAYDKIKMHLVNIAAIYGYFDAKIQQSRILINLAHHSAYIHILFNTGQRYAFGTTQFSKTAIKQSLLKGYLPYQPNTPYNRHQLQTLRENLINSGYFTQVIIRSQKQKWNHKVLIQAQLKQKKSRQYSLGLGFGTDTGIRALLDFDWQPSNVYGHHFKLTAKGASKNRYISVSYLIAGAHPLIEQYALNAGYSTINNPQGSAISRIFGVSYTTSLHTGLLQTLMLRYLKERYRLSHLPKIDSHMLIPSMQWSYLQSDHAINPHRGYRWSVMLSGALKQGFSVESFFQIKANLHVLHTFRKTHIRLLFKGNWGHTIINHITHLPLSLQLLAGGAKSIRGYPYQSIGPGRNLLVGSVELEKKIHGRWYLGAFYDAGSVGDRLIKHWYQGAGPEIVWLSPIGALELSFARRLNAAQKGFSIQLSMGVGL